MAGKSYSGKGVSVVLPEFALSASVIVLPSQATDSIRLTVWSRSVADVEPQEMIRPNHIIDPEQGSAHGSAIHAALAVGAYPDIQSAARATGSLILDAYRPNPDAAKTYDSLYVIYEELYDQFGSGRVMHKRRDIRDKALLVKS